MNFTIGCDPEVFLEDLNGGLKSAVGLLGGDKLAPRSLGRAGFAVLEDNVACEFNIAPASTLGEFDSNIDWAVDNIKKHLGEMNLKFSRLASASFPDKELDSYGAQVFGCDPDYNAWTKKRNPRPRAKDGNLRSCGGHIHVGTEVDPIAVVRAMDLFLGVPSVIADPDVDRRSLYGKAGAHRIKPYGPEYRTLSNFWIFSKEAVKWAYTETGRAVEYAAENGSITNDLGKEIQACINESNVDLARQLMIDFKLNTPEAYV